MMVANASSQDPALSREYPPREHRPRVLKGGSILNGINKSEIPCTVRNQHAHGAELRVSIDWIIAKEFLLYVPVDGICYRCVLRWRRDDKAGVSFHGTEPKPHWHYG